MFPYLAKVDGKKVIHISKMFHSGAHTWAHGRPPNVMTELEAVPLDAS
jgi:hypothetical protein